MNNSDRRKQKQKTRFLSKVQFFSFFLRDDYLINKSFFAYKHTTDVSERKENRVYRSDMFYVEIRF